jgi:hypothetical protein
MDVSEQTWIDAFGASFKTGDIVSYGRRADGGILNLVGRVVGPTRPGDDAWIKLDLLDESVDLIEKIQSPPVRLNLNRSTAQPVEKKPVKRRVNSVCMYSCIRMNEHPNFVGRLT